jgi:Kef-type K+ transport system membrane component KefB
VLGEVLVGVLLGALPGTHFFRDLATDAGVDLLARIGALVLLFEVGVAMTLREVIKVGAAAARVAVLGTIVSFALGLVVARALLPSASVGAQAFLAAAITATSVGISARVLKDLGRAKSVEARTALGAAVIDDVLALIVLSLVTGWIASSASSSSGSSSTLVSIAVLVGKTVGFFVGAVLVGKYVAPRLFDAASRLRTRGALVVVGLVYCFVFSWASDLIGLAPIVGAFTAGLTLEDPHWARFVERGERPLDQELEPISAFLVPLFFALLGLRTDLRVLVRPDTLALAGALSAAAILGKLACGLGAPKGSRRLAVSFAMMPRGEVTLIYASLGVATAAGMQVLDARGYSALVVVVVLTTLATPAALQWSFRARRTP